MNGKGPVNADVVNGRGKEALDVGLEVVKVAILEEVNMPPGLKHIVHVLGHVLKRRDDPVVVLDLLGVRKPDVLGPLVRGKAQGPVEDSVLDLLVVQLAHNLAAHLRGEGADAEARVDELLDRQVAARVVVPLGHGAVGLVSHCDWCYCSTIVKNRKW